MFDLTQMQGNLPDDFDQDHLGLIETVGVGQMPELDEDGRLIMAFEAYMTDMSYLLHDIRQAGGINKALATEAFRLAPSLEAHSPLAFYTESPSQTRYKVSMEELGAGIIAAIAAASAVISYAIYRFIKWIIGSSDDTDDVGDGGKFSAKNPPSVADVEAEGAKAKAAMDAKQEKNAEAAKAGEGLAEELQEVNGALGEGVEEEPQVRNFDDYVAFAIKEGEGKKRAGNHLHKVCNGEYAAILKGDSEWVKEMLVLGPAMLQYVKKLRHNLEKYSNLIEEALKENTEGSVRVHAQNLAEIKELAINDVVPGFAKFTSLPDLVRHFDQLHTQAKDYKSGDDSNPKLLAKLNAMNKIIVSPAFKAVQNVASDLMNEQVQLVHHQEAIRRHLTGVAAPLQAKYSAEISPELHRVGQKLQSDIFAFIRLNHEVMQFENKVAYGLEELKVCIAAFGTMANTVMPKMTDEQKSAISKLKDWVKRSRGVDLHGIPKRRR